VVELWTECELRRGRQGRNVPEDDFPILACAAHHFARHADTRARDLPSVPLAHEETLRVLLFVLFPPFAARGHLRGGRRRLGLLLGLFRGLGGLSMCARAQGADEPIVSTRVHAGRHLVRR